MVVVVTGVTSPADEINAMIRAAAVTIAANHSVTVSSNDAQRVVGGALETPT